MADILTETGQAIISPLQIIGLKIIDFLPSLIGAIIVLIIGYIGFSRKIFFKISEII